MNRSNERVHCLSRTSLSSRDREIFIVSRLRQSPSLFLSSIVTSRRLLSLRGEFGERERKGLCDTTRQVLCVHIVKVSDRRNRVRSTPQKLCILTCSSVDDCLIPRLPLFEECSRVVLYRSKSLETSPVIQFSSRGGWYSRLSRLGGRGQMCRRPVIPFCLAVIGL